MSNLIELKHVGKTFDLETGTKLRVLDDIQLSIRENECVALLGPSGSGKSTCLRIMSGLMPPTDGSVLSVEKPLVGINSQVSLVFQSFALLPWETVFTNIALALSPLHLSKKETNARVKSAVDIVGLEGFEEAYPRELSGGMKQRVGLARALVVQKPLLLLDEPFSSLDILTADTLRSEMIKIFQDQKSAVKSMVLVTHNIQEAVIMANRVLVMSSNPGRIRAEVKVDLPYPRDEKSPLFNRLVAEIHRLITETLIPDLRPSEEAQIRAGKEPPIQTLPKTHINQLIGLLEFIADTGGVSDIFDLANQSQKDFGSTLYLVKSAELLDLVDTPKQKVVLTDLGWNFVRGDINVRKRVLHELFGQLRLIQLITKLLREQQNVRLSSEELIQHLSTWLPNENPQDLLETVISWGRFAEYFGYNDDTQEIYLDLGQEPVQ